MNGGILGRESRRGGRREGVGGREGGYLKIGAGHFGDGLELQCARCAIKGKT